MIQVPFNKDRIDPALYTREDAENELVLREVANPAAVLRAPLVGGNLILVTERSSIHRKLMAIFG